MGSAPANSGTVCKIPVGLERKHQIWKCLCNKWPLAFAFLFAYSNTYPMCTCPVGTPGVHIPGYHTQPTPPLPGYPSLSTQFPQILPGSFKWNLHASQVQSLHLEIRMGRAHLRVDSPSWEHNWDLGPLPSSRSSPLWQGLKDLENLGYQGTLSASPQKNLNCAPWAAGQHTISGEVIPLTQKFVSVRSSSFPSFTCIMRS